MCQRLDEVGVLDEPFLDEDPAEGKAGLGLYLCGTIKICPTQHAFLKQHRAEMPRFGGHVFSLPLSSMCYGKEWAVL